MNATVGFDCETLSYVNLTTQGADVYTADPRTRCLMFCWKPIGIPVSVKAWLEGQPPPDDFVAHVRQGGRLSGWNVINFDRRVYDRILVLRHGFPPMAPEAWEDTSHRAAYANLPRSLDGCAQAVGLGFRTDLKDVNRIRRVTNAEKSPLPTTMLDAMSGARPVWRTIDGRGRDLPREQWKVEKYLTPSGVEIAAEHFDDLTWLAERCPQDVELEEAIALRLPPWPTFEPWLSMPAIDRRINDRGILIDVSLVQGLVMASTIETARLDVDMAKLTDGQVPKCTQIEKLKEWLIANKVELVPNEPDADDGEDSVEDEDAKPADRKSPWRLAKNDIADLLSRDGVPDKCRLALMARAEAARASARKLRTMLGAADRDGRLLNTMTLGGAQQTLRFASSGVNLYNTVRDVYGNPDEIADLNGLDAKKDKERVRRLGLVALDTAIRAGRTGDPELLRQLYEAPRKDAQGRVQIAGVNAWISRMVRRTLSVPDGMAMLNGDWAQIEARITVWLAQQVDILHAFATGQDVYKATAAGMFGVSIDAVSKQMRQSGKVGVLACGFGGGTNALMAMAYNYGMILSEQQATEIVTTWRQSNQAVKNYWIATETASINAVMYSGHEFPVAPLGIVSYFMKDDCLCCRLPSGRLLRYWQPRLSQGKWPDGRLKDRPDLTGIAIKGRSIFRRYLGRTVLVENQVQAIGVDCLAVALTNADRANIPVVLHVYDSLAAEVAEDRAEATLPAFERCMLEQSTWTNGLPIAVDADYGARFG